MSEGFWVPFTVKKAVSFRILKACSQVAILVEVDVFVQRFEVGGLLYSRAGSRSHHEPVPTIDPIWSVEGRESLTFFTDRDGPVRTEPIHSEIILVPVQLLDLVNR